MLEARSTRSSRDPIIISPSSLGSSREQRAGAWSKSPPMLLFAASSSIPDLVVPNIERLQSGKLAEHRHIGNAKVRDSATKVGMLHGVRDSSYAGEPISHVRSRQGASIGHGERDAAPFLPTLSSLYAQRCAFLLPGSAALGQPSPSRGEKHLLASVVQAAGLDVPSRSSGSSAPPPPAGR
eukprot:scaffold1178_cov252-Pinguiococcus_pyrenoidosus.AAC.46